MDDGVGMEAEIVEQAPSPFFTTKDGSEHPGLGLSTAFGLARAAGGLLDLESRPGVGTTVTVYLPAAGTEPPRPAQDGGDVEAAPVSAPPLDSARAAPPSPEPLSRSDRAVAEPESPEGVASPSLPGDDDLRRWEERTVLFCDGGVPPGCGCPTGIDSGAAEGAVGVELGELPGGGF